MFRGSIFALQLCLQLAGMLKYFHTKIKLSIDRLIDCPLHSLSTFWSHLMRTRLDICFYNFHMFRFSRPGVGRLMYIVLYLNIARLVQITMCFFVMYDYSSHLGIDASPYMKFMHTWTDF